MIQTVPTDEKGTPRPGVNGGLFRKDRPEMKESKPVNYIPVESTDGTIKKVEALGAKSFNQNKNFRPWAPSPLLLPKKAMKSDLYNQKCSNLGNPSKNNS